MKITIITPYENKTINIQHPVAIKTINDNNRAKYYDMRNGKITKILGLKNKRYLNALLQKNNGGQTTQ